MAEIKEIHGGLEGLYHIILEPGERVIVQAGVKSVHISHKISGGIYIDGKEITGGEND